MPAVLGYMVLGPGVLGTSGAATEVPRPAVLGYMVLGAGVLGTSGAATGDTCGGPIPIDELRDYLGLVGSWTDDDLCGALRAEAAAQAARCRVATFTVDLREALKRRVARNLAARAVPIAQFTSFEGGGTSSRVPTVDPEIKRLEAPYRRHPIG